MRMEDVNCNAAVARRLAAAADLGVETGPIHPVIPDTAIDQNVL